MKSRTVRGGGIANLDAAIAGILNKVNSLKKYVVGSYTGKGTYGETNRNSLTFGFVPSLIIILGFTLNSGNNRYSSFLSDSFTQCAILTSLVSETYAQYPLCFHRNSRSECYIKKTNDGKTVQWYHDSYAEGQYNLSGEVYYYIAFE